MEWTVIIELKMFTEIVRVTFTEKNRLTGLVCALPHFPVAKKYQVLPAIVVTGDQCSKKSIVLEALLGDAAEREQLVLENILKKWCMLAKHVI